jgi:hypothetical protein
MSVQYCTRNHGPRHHASHMNQCDVSSCAQVPSRGLVQAMHIYIPCTVSLSAIRPSEGWLNLVFVTISHANLQSVLDGQRHRNCIACREHEAIMKADVEQRGCSLPQLLQANVAMMSG